MLIFPQGALTWEQGSFAPLVKIRGFVAPSAMCFSGTGGTGLAPCSVPQLRRSHPRPCSWVSAQAWLHSASEILLCVGKWPSWQQPRPGVLCWGLYFLPETLWRPASQRPWKPRTANIPTLWAWSDRPAAPCVCTGVFRQHTRLSFLCVGKALAENGWRRVYAVRVQVRWVLVCRMAHGGPPRGSLPAALALGRPRGRAEPFGGNSILSQGYK